jgi:hypothetical protein
MSAQESLRHGTQQLAESARSMSRQAQSQLEALEPTLRQVDERVRSLARERPLLALGGALIAGYLIGRMLAARR